MVTMESEKPHKYLKKLEKLVSSYPNSPFLVVRLAKAYVLLEDLHESIALFEKTIKLLDNDRDPRLEAYVAGLKDFANRNEKEEANEWRGSEDAVVLSAWSPPQSVDSYDFGALSIAADVKNAWNSLLDTRGADLINNRYGRLLAVESNEIEKVFLLAGDSLPRLVRAGFFTGAIDGILDSGSEKPEPSKVIFILQGFQKSLDMLVNIIMSSPRISEEQVYTLHSLLMKTSEISAIRDPDSDELVYYFVRGGKYRKRLVTSSLEVDGKEGVVQYTKWQDIRSEMAIFFQLMEGCLTKDLSPFVAAAWIHSTFARIHPFTDGNGRIARLIASLPLVKVGYPFINIRKDMMNNYLKALFVAQTTRNLQPLAVSLAESMLGSISYIASLPPPSPDDKLWATTHDLGRTRLNL